MGTLAGSPGASNYTFAAANNAVFTIIPLAITVTFTNQTKLYGDIDPPFGYVSVPPLVTLPSQPQDSFSGAPTRVAGEAVVIPSPYIISKGSLTLGANTPNYTVTWVTAKLTINKKPVVVTAVATQNRVYGDPIAIPADLVSYNFFWTGNPRVPNQSAPATTVPTLDPAAPLTQCSLPGNYTFKVKTAGSDPNYDMQLGSPASVLDGTVTVTKAPLTITAENKTKIYDGTPYTNFTAAYRGFVTACGDTKDNSLSGILTFCGDAVAATAPGVYQILPSGYDSQKYAISNAPGLYAPGWLTITVPPQTKTISGNVTWSGAILGLAQPTYVTNWAWMANQANGNVGANPGWNLLNITGTLNIQALSTDRFRLDLVTLLGGGTAAGQMNKFDPTRPYSWEIVRAANIVGFDSTAIWLNWQASLDQGADLFLNKVFNGVFSITKNIAGTSLYLNFTPMGSTGNYVVAVPPGYDVGTSLSDQTKMLGNINNRDIDMLYLSPSKTSVNPQEPVTINLNVANLKQNIIGVAAYINFSSTFFGVDETGAEAPVVAPGGGPWQNVIYKKWNTSGDLDTVVAVWLTNTVGTIDNGTVATITLTPNRHAVGSSRVVFRADGQPKLDGTGGLTTYLVPIVSGAAAVLPARVMTDEITVTPRGTPGFTGFEATQVQPGSASPVPVKNGTAVSRTQTVATSAGIPSGFPSDTNTISGPVIFTINANDDGGVGLRGPPLLVLSNYNYPSVALVTVSCTEPTRTTAPFVYNWTVPANIAQGLWTAIVTATDMLQAPQTPAGPTVTVANPAFSLDVNTTEVNGVVELESFAGTNRTVTFSNPSRQWNWTPNFISGDLLNAGSFASYTDLAAKIWQPLPAVAVSQWDVAVSYYLRYGTNVDLPTLAAKLKNQTGGVSEYIHDLLYGYINDLPAIASTLVNPQRAVDVYVVNHLSAATIVLLHGYTTNSPAAYAAELTQALLNDFNTIVLDGNNLWDPVRFAGVCAQGWPYIDQVTFNRHLLENAYVTNCSPYMPNYVPGQLGADTAQRLTTYAGGSDPLLANYLLRDFDTMTLTSSMWPTPTPGHAYDQGLYNQTIFLGVDVSADTELLLLAFPAPTSPTMTLLNRYLLRDAYRGLYQTASLSPATVATTVPPVSQGPFNVAMVANLNLLIDGNSRIYTPPAGTYNPSGELGQLLAIPWSALTTNQKIRENRLLLELVYPTQLSQSVLATYRLVQMPPSENKVSAKTAWWNLRVTQSGGFLIVPGTATTVNFVNGGVLRPFLPGSDFYLRAGDMNGNNVIDLLDYNILRATWARLPADLNADVNGDGKVDGVDYGLLLKNWAKSGDAE